jgi:hypothetical protein
MTITSPAAASRTRQILEDLEAVRENLLALSDDIWLSIDHNDPAALEAGVEFKRAFNEKAAAFDVVASDLSAIVQRYTSVRLEEAEESGGSDRAANERIIAELNREEPHDLRRISLTSVPTASFWRGRGRRASRPGNGCMSSSAGSSSNRTRPASAAWESTPTSSATEVTTR